MAAERRLERPGPGEQDTAILAIRKDLGDELGLYAPWVQIGESAANN